MLEKMSIYLDLLARALMAAIYILSGFGKLSAISATQSYMQAYGVPPGLLAPTIVFEIGGGLLFLFGCGTRVVGIVLAVFTLGTALIFHSDFNDHMQVIQLLKNMAMTGGFLAIAAHGATGLSVDRLIAARRRP